MLQPTSLRSSLTHMIAVVLTIGVLASPQSWSGPVAAAHPLPADLAAMMLTPDDFAQAGLAGFGRSSGRALSVDDLAARVVWPVGEGDALMAAREALLAAGWSQAQAAVLTTVRDLANPGAVSDVEIEVVAYGDAHGASEGFLLVPDAYPTGDMVDVAGSVTIGDESRVTRIEGHDPGSGTPTQELALGFRSGRLTTRILIRNLSTEAPQVAEIEFLARTLESRIELVLQGDAPDLSLQAIRVHPKDDMTYAADGYVRLGGEDFRSAFESPAEFGSRTAAYGNATDIFTSRTQILARDSSYNLDLSVILYRFAGEDNATTWFQNLPNHLGHQPGLISISVETGMASNADEMSTATFARVPGTGASEIVHSAVVFIRFGAIVAEIRLDRPYDPPPMQTALKLAGRQADCLGQENCHSPVPIAVSSAGEPD